MTSYSLEREAWRAWQFDQPEKRKGVVQAFRRDASIYKTARVKLRGLEPRARYRLTDLDAAGPAKEYSAEELINHGLTPHMLANDRTDYLCHTNLAVAPLI